MHIEMFLHYIRYWNPRLVWFSIRFPNVIVFMLFLIFTKHSNPHYIDFRKLTILFFLSIMSNAAFGLFKKVCTCTYILSVPCIFNATVLKCSHKPLYIVVISIILHLWVFLNVHPSVVLTFKHNENPIKLCS